MTTSQPYIPAATHETHRPWTAAEDRHAKLGYRRVGSSGLYLPPISLGLWWNFGDNRTFDTQRDVLRYAFENGITHFDLANNYGPPYGSAEENFGRMLRGDFKAYRDELIVSSKAGYDMWPGPYGNGGSRKYVISSAEASLSRLGLDYVDLFYSHRHDPNVPIAETVGALDTLVRQGKALYVGISSYSAQATREAVAEAAKLGTPLVIHQPSYSLLNRWVEPELLTALAETGLGSIAFTPLAQGLLTGKYLDHEDAVPAGGRSSVQSSLTPTNLAKARALNEVAQKRGQALAQMAIAWLLRPAVDLPDGGRSGGVSSVLIGASSTRQLKENLAAVDSTGATAFSDEESARIEEICSAQDPNINPWHVSSDL
jgi:L-glyceraldehyde 3-phosphate reductase